MNHFIASKAWFFTVDSGGNEDEWFGMPKFLYNNFGNNEIVWVDTEIQHELVIGDTYEFKIRGVNQCIEDINNAPQFEFSCGKYVLLAIEVFPDNTDDFFSGVRHRYSFYRTYKKGSVK